MGIRGPCFFLAMILCACAELVLGPVAMASNPIQAENGQAGTTAWQLSNPATNREIEGYASLASVNQGGQVSLYVNTADPAYTIDVFRIGWYGGAGGREVLGPVTLPGIKQIIPAPDSTGMIECQWINPYTITIPSTWLSGIYLAKLTGSNSGKQSYIIFTVREDSRPSAYVFTSSVTTYQAYNNWPGYAAGGKSLYDFNSFNGAAVKVSFNRPYALGPQAASSAGVGAGDLITNIQPSSSTLPGGWEINMLRFLEREGYDVTYITSMDLHENGTLLLSHRAYLSVGHDEYWSWQMRANVEFARDSGVGLGFFASNVCYWEVRFEPSPANGAADRTMVGFKANYTNDPYYYDNDPTNDKYITYLWRANFGGKPSEQAFIGVEYITNPVDGDIIVTAAPSNWALQGTGLVGGDHLQGLLGYEVDGMLDTDSPPNKSVIAQTPLSNGGPHPFSEMTSYVAPSGATVFATGSMHWSWGLDDYNVPNVRNSRLSPAAQQITRNVLSRLVTLTTGGAAQYIATDGTTQGSWKAAYGQNGYIIANDSNNPASYAAVNITDSGVYTWAASTTDVRALVKSGSATDRIASGFYGTKSLAIDINLTDGLTHQLAFYALDWDNQQRTETFTILDGANRAVLDTRTISNFASGQYLVWNLSGHVIVNVVSSAGPNAVVSGIFFEGSAGPDLTIRKTHNGNFAPGDVGDVYTIIVTNSGGAATSGAVSVTDTLPAGLTATAIGGAGWTCTQPAGPCSRPDSLNGGASFPPVAVTVNVASNAPPSVTNTAAVSGGGDTNIGNNSASDLTTILVAPLVPTTFLSGYALNGPALRNDITGWLGMTLQIGGGNMVVDSVGRICLAGNAGTHIVKFVTASNGTDVPGGSVSVSMTGCVPGQFVYGYFPSSIVLQKNTGYYLVSQEVKGGDQWYDVGAISATADASVNGGIYSLDGSTWYTAANLASNTSFIPANFRYVKQSIYPVSVTVQPGIAGASFSVDGISYTSAQVFNWTSGSAHTIATTSPQAGAPGTQYAWTNWSDGGSMSHVVSPSTSTTLIANFTTQYLLTSAGSPSNSGTISTAPASASGYYANGTSVQLTATGNSGYGFANWSGDLSGTTNPQTLTMGAPHGVTANFHAAGPSTGSSPGFLTGYDLNGAPLRNDFAGWVGMKLTVGASGLTVSSLGRICVAGNSGTHSIKFVSAATGSDLPGASLLLNMSGCVGGQFVYAALPSQITLQANTAYYLVSLESSGGDRWYDHGAVTSTKDASVNNSAWFDGVNWDTYDGPNTSYVPANFQYVTSGSSPSPSPSPSNAFVTSFNLNSPPLRNNFSGWVGTRINVGTNPLSVASLGRLCISGNSLSHTLKFVQGSSGTDVVSVSVNMAGCVPGQFTYANLANPVTLPAGAAYYLVSQETAGGDTWYDHGGIATTNVATATNSAWSPDSVNWYVFDSTNTAYVPPNFTYTASSPVSPPVSSPASSLVTGFNLTNPPLRSNFTGFVGMQFSVGANAILVTQVGRLCAPGNSGIHQLEFVNAGTKAVLPNSGVSVNMAGCTPGQFVYAPLSSVVLQANTGYYLVSQEVNGADQWYDFGGITTTSVASVSNPIWSYDGITWSSINAPNSSYVPLSFTY